nr:hypothetical protein CDL15_Pgr019679 [Ipomoea batatas]
MMAGGEEGETYLDISSGSVGARTFIGERRRAALIHSASRAESLLSLIFPMMLSIPPSSISSSKIDSDSKSSSNSSQSSNLSREFESISLGLPQPASSLRGAAGCRVNFPGGFLTVAENIFGYAVDRRAAASLYVWFGRFRGVRAFLVEIATGELLFSERVDDGDEDCDAHDVDGDLIISSSNL